jgi:hypothetical protein
LAAVRQMWLKGTDGRVCNPPMPFQFESLSDDSALPRLKRRMWQAPQLRSGREPAFGPEPTTRQAGLRNTPDQAFLGRKGPDALHRCYVAKALATYKVG